MGTGNGLSSGREILPIPDRQHIGLTTYDAKDPDTSFLPIQPLRPPMPRRSVNPGAISSTMVCS